MADKPRFLDVWIVETNTVYREVPFTVAVDWVQQGRLLEDDMLRWSGQAEWFPIGTKPIFAAYLPRIEPHRADDQAEVLEPVQVDFSWKHRGDEDEDVDMIPLIDVSLVLLIFFIMTTASVLAPTSIVLPASESGLVMENPNLMWISFKKDERGEVVYSLGFGKEQAQPEDNNIPSRDQLLTRLDARLAEHPELVGVNVQGSEDLPWGIDRWLQDELKRRRIPMILIGVREKG